MAALDKAKEDLERERCQWREEKAFLLDSLRKVKNTPEEKEEIDKIEVQERKKPKRRSLWRRFLQLFR